MNFGTTAGAFTIAVNVNQSVNFTGAGVTNNSSVQQNFGVDSAASGHGTITFDLFNAGSATAGNNTKYTMFGGGIANQVEGVLQFYSTSTAGGASIDNREGQIPSAGGGLTQFFNGSNAANSAINNQGGISGNGGFTQFFNTATAGSATITSFGGASLIPRPLPPRVSLTAAAGLLAHTPALLSSRISRLRATR